MIDIPKPLLEYLEKAQYVEQSPRDWFILKVNDTEIAVDLRGEKPKVGVLVGGVVQEEGHGISKVQDIRNKVEYLWSKGAGNRPAEGTKEPGKKKEEELAPKLGPQENTISKGEGDKQTDMQRSPETSQKLGPAAPPAPQPKQWQCSKCGKPVDMKRADDTASKYLNVFCKDCEPIFDQPKPAPKQAEVVGKFDARLPPMGPGVKNNNGGKKMEEKGLTVQDKAQPPAKQMTDQERDDMIEKAKAKRFLESQGEMYKVSGKERPDAAMIQSFANEVGISVEILKAIQTDDYAEAVVRGHLGNRYIDAAVHHDFKTEFQLTAMELIAKNPEILDHFEGTVPVIKEGATIRQGDKRVDAKYHLIHTLLTFKGFSLRDAVTKAGSIAQKKLLNQSMQRDETDREKVEAQRVQNAQEVR